MLTSLVLLLAAAAQNPPKDEQDIDFEFRVEKAIEKGVAALKGRRIGISGHENPGNALILLTLIHAGVPEDNPDYKALLKEALEDELIRTYQVALVAMSLEEHDRVKYQWRLHQCAQFFADNVSDKGHLGYGTPSRFASSIPREEPPKPSRTGTSRKPQPDEKGEKPKPIRLIPVRKKGKPENQNYYDHSNMQYLALGMRACHDSGIIFEKTLLRKIRDWWRNSQKPDKDAKVEPLTLDVEKRSSRTGAPSTRAMIRFAAKPVGWAYTKDGMASKQAYGSMTAGAVGALCIYDYMLGEDWRTDPVVLEGLQWMSKHFSVTENPKTFVEWQERYYYYMYAMERMGMLYGTELIGKHRWYREGAEELLRRQNAQGSWGYTYNTCLAILFLQRATRSLSIMTGKR